MREQILLGIIRSFPLIFDRDPALNNLQREQKRVALPKEPTLSVSDKCDTRPNEQNDLGLRLCIRKRRAKTDLDSAAARQAFERVKLDIPREQK